MKNYMSKIAIVFLLGLVGALLPAHLEGVKRVQSIFIFADLEITLNEQCLAVALGHTPVMPDFLNATQCGSVIRAKDLYEAGTLAEAKNAFNEGLVRDRIIFSLLGVSVALIVFLVSFCVRRAQMRPLKFRRA